MIVLIAIVAGNQRNIRKAVFAQAIPTDFFEAFSHIEASLYQVAGDVYAFEMGFARSMLLDTPEGIAVIDTISEAHAQAMKQAIQNRFPDKSVRWVLFSHHHLDHIRGSDQFPGAEIIGHEAINALVGDWTDTGLSIASVTQGLNGDQTLNLGGLMVEALYMPYSHSHTLYAFYIPEYGAVYAPDMMFVKGLPPYDFPDFYYPGYIRALDRLIELDALHYVPSHMERGELADLVDYRNMTVEFQEVVKAEVLKHGIESALSGVVTRESLKSAYDLLQPKYGDWHGFDAMFVPKFGRHLSGTYLGY